MQIRRELFNLARDMRYIEQYLAAGYELPEKYRQLYQTIQKLYEQQKYMYDNHTHSVPDRIVSALSVALYGMFIAIIIPPARDNRIIGTIVVISMAASFLFTKAPVLCQISSGFRIIILTILIAGIAAYFFPVKEETNPEDKEDSSVEA